MLDFVLSGYGDKKCLWRGILFKMKNICNIKNPLSKRMIQSFDANYKVWHEFSGVISERLTDVNKILSLKEYFTNCRCAYGERIHDCNNISVLNRIGSPSMEAEVYDTYLVLPEKSYHFASKIMPIIESKNNTEIGIATQASDLVLQGICEYFPIVYSSAFCDSVIYKEGSALKTQSIEWMYKQQLLKLTENTSYYKRATTLLRTSLDSMKSEIEAKLGCDIVFSQAKSFPAHILVSEMAWGDLNSFCKQYSLSDENWGKFINMIFSGIICLQKHLSIVHNDLHFGNVLVFMNFNNIIPLIHDFGRSEKISEKIDYIRDIEKLVESVLKTESIPRSIKDKMDCTKQYAETLIASDVEGKDIMEAVIEFYNRL